MIKVLLVDDHDLVRTGIKKIFKEVSGIERSLRKREPVKRHLVLMDVKMPGIGVEVLMRQENCCA